MNDPAEQIAAVHRRIDTRADDSTARILVIGQTYAADVDDVWDACTNPERIEQWFLPISGDLRVGGRYEFEGSAGGEIQSCERPKSFAATWEHDGETSWIEVALTTDPAGGTRFEMVHTAFVDDNRWNEFGPGAGGVGWDISLLGLATHLAGGTTGSEQEWAETAPGIEFMTRSSRLWCEADIAAGTDPAVARAAADRTTAFYTGASAEA